MCIEQVSISPLSMFMGKGYLQHGTSKKNGSHSSKGHVYMMPRDVGLHEAIQLAYDDLLNGLICHRNGMDRCCRGVNSSVD